MRLPLNLLTIMIVLFSCQQKNASMNSNCDPETGICTPTTLLPDSNISKENESLNEIIYVGDPMCSWCWGISPVLNELKAKYEGIYKFKVVVGGLRPGGGDAWTPEFKTFLKHHWEEVNERSGQPFSYSLFDKASFNYDTEPSCRAILCYRALSPLHELIFFEAIQHKFYVENEDPNEVQFYKSICEAHNLNYTEFEKLFLSQEMKQATHKEFLLNRSWGVNAYPTILFKSNERMDVLSRGYTNLNNLVEKINKIEK